MILLSGAYCITFIGKEQKLRLPKHQHIFEKVHYVGKGFSARVVEYEFADLSLQVSPVGYMIRSKVNKVNKSLITRFKVQVHDSL